MGSKQTIQRVRGMQDVLPEDRPYWDLLEANAAALAHRYGFQRVDLPILEFTELYERGVGTGSDFFVQKEMYTLEEEEGASITLRPEFTPGYVRAYLQHGMASWPQPVKLYTIGPIFRRESPQAGRYRQHSQFNAEIIGEIDPAADLEVMLLAMHLCQAVGYKDLTFQLNSTGCPECKPAYVAALRNYMDEHADKLAPVDQERMRRNPLRILDSKEPGMDALLESAPHIIDYLCDDCDSHFTDLTGLLDELDQGYSINFRLVRGMDYYTKTVFEVWAEGIGAQAALIGGGRYDGLAEQIGGPATPAVGFGSGIERIILGLKQQGIELATPPPPPVLIAHFGGATKAQAVQLAYQLRYAGIGATLAFARERRSMKSQMREADKQQASIVLIVGEAELAEGVVTVRPLDGEAQTTVPLDAIVAWLTDRPAA